jgi:hypothetical protein
MADKIVLGLTTPEVAISGSSQWTQRRWPFTCTITGLTAGPDSGKVWGTLGWYDGDGLIYKVELGVTTDPQVCADLITTQAQVIAAQIAYFDAGGNTVRNGAYREVLPAGSPFWTSDIWYTSVGKTQKIQETLRTLNATNLPTGVSVKQYDAGGALFRTVTDTITYVNGTESTRTRVVT